MVLYNLIITAQHKSDPLTELLFTYLVEDETYNASFELVNDVLNICIKCNTILQAAHIFYNFHVLFGYEFNITSHLGDDTAEYDETVHNVAANYPSNAKPNRFLPVIVNFWREAEGRRISRWLNEADTDLRDYFFSGY